MVHLGFIVKTIRDDLDKGIQLLADGIATNHPGTSDGRFYFHLGDALQRKNRTEEVCIQETDRQTGRHIDIQILIDGHIDIQILIDRHIEIDRHTEIDRHIEMVRAFAHGAMGRWIDSSWGGPIELFLVPASAPGLA